VTVVLRSSVPIRWASIASLPGQLREALIGEIRSAVAATARALVEDEVLELVGELWSCRGASPLRRNGDAHSTIQPDGVPFSLVRTPRARDRPRATEVPLRTLERFSSSDALGADVKRRLFRGRSTRDYDDALSALSNGLGLKESAVSTAFVRASKDDLNLLNGRLLAGMTFVAVFLDGALLTDHTRLVALGIRQDGRRLGRGRREGAREDGELVHDLLAILQERGLTLTRRAVLVLHGPKALGKAVRVSFGD